MYYLQALFSNRILIASISAWLIAQIFKVVNNLIIHKEFSFERLFGDGGMPSGHSATVSAMATSVALDCGLDSVEFAIALIVAIIVMHDAHGVRYETGKQAKKLNELMQIIETLSSEKTTDEEKFKELIGHTPAQVAAGAALGVLIGILFWIFFPIV